MLSYHKNSICTILRKLSSQITLALVENISFDFKSKPNVLPDLQKSLTDLWDLIVQDSRILTNIDEFDCIQ